MLVAVPIILYLALMLFIAIQVNKKKKAAADFTEE